MALGTTNITTTLVKNLIGSAFNSVANLVGAAGLNPYSYYAPGQLGVDANKNIVLTPPTASFKLGDFRSYDHSAVKPGIFSPANHAWGPGGSTCSFTMLYNLETLNLYAFTERGDYVTMDFYASSANRSAGTNRRHRQMFTIPVTGDTPLPGHSRQSAYKVNTSGWIPCTITNFDTSWLSADTNIYVETYISDMSNNRKINFGTSLSDGYSDLILHQYGEPYLYGKNTNVPTPPSGYTTIFPAVYAYPTPICSYGATLEQTFNGTTYAFYLDAKGIYGTGSRIVALDSVDIILTKDGIRTTIATGVALSHTSGMYCSGTLAGGGTWNYDSVGEVTFENATIQATPLYTQC
jgi:hypothetical protein